MDGFISFRFFLKRHGSCHDRYKIVAPCKVLHFYNLPHEFENKVLAMKRKERNPMTTLFSSLLSARDI